ncbi:F-box protein SKIP23-like [Tripterygium wilfordii]|uniref:F-box protein SKIP23-like n=1 Tax=Tripterygium wilfordii TaxID=458696 RepID=A0A7J7D3J1_TRIWF|nr:F-box protein SKIP23-like [Tripterygium wilfordii]KAF5740900.1 F-box protein SKIP23-like [Tripterygium wilfordii]
MPRDWANLDTDLIGAIVKRLRIEDHIRLQAVCKGWLSALKESTFQPQPHRQIPWLALPDGNSDTCRLYSLTDKKIHHIELPEIRERRCCGTAHGWMVMVDNSANVLLLNPLTRSQIPLPPITTFPEISEIGEGKYYYPSDMQIEMQSGEFVKKSFLEKVVLSGNPSLAKDYVVMAIYGNMQRLAFCKEGDDKWTLLEHEDQTFFDVVYWKGNFYATNSTGRVAVCDLAGPVPKARIFMIPQPKIVGSQNYLVPSGNELLLVSKKLKVRSRDMNDITSWNLNDVDEHHNEYGDNYDHEEEVYGNANYDDHEDDGVDNIDIVEENPNYEDNDDDDNNWESDDNEDEVDDYDNRVFLYKTEEFRVFKLDEEKLFWVKVTSLDDRILFVGYNFGLSLSANDFPECKADHIYFTDDRSHIWNDHIVGGHDLGVYSLKNGEIEPFPCCPESTWLIWPPPYWVTLSPY